MSTEVSALWKSSIGNEKAVFLKENILINKKKKKHVGLGASTAPITYYKFRAI